ncbi:MAG: MFS transporter [Vicinamibacterales bacterium]
MALAPGWWRAADADARRALLAASLGWMLDSFDVMLYALLVATLIVELEMTRVTAGLLASLTLVASAAGGLLFGILADRYGRTRALIWSILIYSVFTAACGLAQSVLQLAVFRLFLGLGMGGEWASGAALVSETWPAEHRGKALGLMQSAWAIGYALAVIVTALVLPRWGWRAVFFAGIVPALFTLWIRRHVREPHIWQRARTAPVAARDALAEIFRPPLLRLTTWVTLMNACTMFAWWGFNSWVPAYLELPVDEGGVGLGVENRTGILVIMQAGMWLGYVSFGFISDRVGRKRAYVTYLTAAAALLVAYASTSRPGVLLALGPFLAFFATGYFSGFGAVTAEIYRTQIRATAQGFTYNIGRVASAAAPFAVGSLAERHGFSAAFMLAAVAFVLAAGAWTFIPETKGRVLQ